MLFMSDTGKAGSFWMKGMRFPLDFVWISEECLVVDVTPDVPSPGPDTPDSELISYFSQERAVFTLEINAGEAADNGITVGAQARLAGVPGNRAAECE